MQYNKLTLVMKCARVLYVFVFKQSHNNLLGFVIINLHGDMSFKLNVQVSLLEQETSAFGTMPI